MGKKSAKVRVKQAGGPSAAKNPLAGLMQPPALSQEDMIMPPPRGDPSVSIPWPSTTSSRSSSSRIITDASKFVAIYPTYLDKNKSVKVGRRIAASDAVDCPIILDLSDACRALRWRHLVQPWKGYPRDPDSRWNNPGRVMVDVESINTSSSSSVTTKKELIQKIARIIPTMPTRVQRVQEKITKKKQQEEKERAKAAEKAAAASVAVPKKKGKGKKKR